MSRIVLVVTNPHRPATLEAGAVAEAALAMAGVEAIHSLDGVDPADVSAAMVLGGDGTMLYAVERTYGTGIPLLGVNLGRVGFLAELEKDDVARAAKRLAAGEYTVERRVTLDVEVSTSRGDILRGWALNEVTIERANTRRILDVMLEVDRVPLSSFGCDGLIVATATGSTAHAFSAGGPVMWPDVDALLCVPLAAHALFARPLVIGPQSSVGIRISASADVPAQVSLDGSRSLEVEPGQRVDVSRGHTDVPLARLSDAPFTQRLVAKFSLPTDGWRGEG